MVGGASVSLSKLQSKEAMLIFREGLLWTNVVLMSWCMRMDMRVWCLWAFMGYLRGVWWREEVTELTVADHDHAVMLGLMYGLMGCMEVTEWSGREMGWWLLYVVCSLNVLSLWGSRESEDTVLRRLRAKQDVMSYGV